MPLRKKAVLHSPTSRPEEKGWIWKIAVALKRVGLGLAVAGATMFAGGCSITSVLKQLVSGFGT